MFKNTKILGYTLYVQNLIISRRCNDRGDSPPVLSCTWDDVLGFQFTPLETKELLSYCETKLSVADEPSDLEDIAHLLDGLSYKDWISQL